VTASTRILRNYLAALELWDGVDVARLPADEALEAVEAGAHAMHALQGLIARFAARVDAVCEQSPGVTGYARRHGYASGPALLAARSGFSPGEMARMASLGHALLAADAEAARAVAAAEVAVGVDGAVAGGALDGMTAGPGPELLELAPSADPKSVARLMTDFEGATSPQGAAILEGNPHLGTSTAVGFDPAGEPQRELGAGEYLARAVDSGQLGPQHAEVIRATLADFTIDSRDAEREFVDFARRVGLRKLKQHCFWRLGELDPTGLASREERQRRERFVSVTDGPDGMITFYGKVDVVAGAPLKTLIDAMSAAAVRRQRKLPREERFNAGQLCADALADVALHALSCEHVPRSPKTTVVVRIDQEALVNDLCEAGLVDADGVPSERGASLASCDCVLQPITASTARLMAVEAQILPAVMGGEPMPLDLGRSKRLFSKAQKLAVVERDQGCIRCAAPPAFCHQHHVKFWSEDGPTDRTNAATLCTGCHHRLHEQAWELVMIDGRFVVSERDVQVGYLSRERGDPSVDPLPAGYVTGGRDPARQPTRSERHRQVPVA